MAIAVYISRPPHSAFLVGWGRHLTGWWACITFQAALEGADQGELAVAAWVPAHAVTRPAWSATENVRRIALPADHATWPGPPRWPSWYAGVWSDGPLPLPPGLILRTGPAWRKTSSDRSS